MSEAVKPGATEKEAREAWREMMRSIAEYLEAHRPAGYAGERSWAWALDSNDGEGRRGGEG